MKPRTRPEPGVRRTGLAIAVAFFAGALIDFIYLGFYHHTGVFPALLHPYTLACLVLGAVALGSTYDSRLVWFQPLIFLLGVPLSVKDASFDGFFSLGFFSVGILLLFRMGAFERKRAVKFVSALGFYFVCEFAAALMNHKEPAKVLARLFFVSIFFLFLYFSYKERLMVYLKEPKPQVSLAGLGITPLEAGYVFALIEGKTAKEMAYDFAVTESTARNNIARCLHKLGLEDRHAFTVFTMEHEIVA